MFGREQRLTGRSETPRIKWSATVRWIASLARVPHIAMLAGALVIETGGTLVGGIGVSGAPGGEGRSLRQGGVGRDQRQAGFLTGLQPCPLAIIKFTGIPRGKKYLRTGGRAVRS